MRFPSFLIVYSLAVLLAASAIAQPPPVEVPDTDLDLPRPEIPAIPTRVSAGYFICNLLQIRVERQPVWESVYQSLGATSDEIRRYTRATQRLRDYICDTGELDLYDGSPTDRLIRQRNTIKRAIDERISAHSGLTLDEATRLRLESIRRNMERWREMCRIGEIKETEALFSPLPLTPGVTSTGEDPANLLSAVGFGDCSQNDAEDGGVGLGDFSADSQNSIAECIDRFAAKAADCQSPVATEGADIPAHGATEEELDREKRELGIPDDYGKKYDSGWQENEDGSKRRTRVFENPGGERIRVDQELSEDPEHGAVYVRRDMKYDDDGEPTSLDVQVHSEDGKLNHYHHQDITTMEEFSEDFGIWKEAAELFVDIWTGQCRSLNPSSQNPIGYEWAAGPSRGIAAGGLKPTVEGPKFLGGDNAFAYCLCEEGGGMGRTMANQLGYSCGNNNDRLACLSNPTDPNGPPDSIRPECIKYGFQVDSGLYYFNPHEAPNPGEMCESVVQCPPEARAMAGIDIQETLMRCACAGPGGGLVAGTNPRGGSQCGYVDCPAGPVGSDSTGGTSYDECCVTPEPGLGSRVEFRPVDEHELPGLAQLFRGFLVTDPRYFSSMIETPLGQELIRELLREDIEDQDLIENLNSPNP